MLRSVGVVFKVGVFVSEDEACQDWLMRLEDVLVNVDAGGIGGCVDMPLLIGGGGGIGVTYADVDVVIDDEDGNVGCAADEGWL